MTKNVDIKDFARQVERLCDFLIAKKSEETGKDGSDDLAVIEDLKEDAADIQFSSQPASDTLNGLDAYMKGADIAPAD